MHSQILFIREVADVSHVFDQRIEAWQIARLPPGSSVPTAGYVQACVCRSCGFTELYTYEPDRIPIDGVQVALLEAPAGEDPYR